MKNLFRLSKLAFALLIMTTMITSCVEEEQNPYDLNDNGSQDSEKFDAKLPNPDNIRFYVGDEVIVKGSGLKNDDEIYIKLRYDEEESGEDLNGDGIIQKSIIAKAEIKECSSEKLTFIIPEETDPYTTSNYDYNVYLKRNGEEYKLGVINVNNMYNNADSHYVTLSRDEGYECAFPQNTKVYLQKFIRNTETGKLEFTGEKNYLNIVESQDYYILCDCQGITGEWMVFCEANGEKMICGEIYF